MQAFCRRSSKFALTVLRWVQECKRCTKRVQVELGLTIQLPVHVTSLDAGLMDYCKLNVIEGFRCPECQTKGIADASWRFETAPNTLVVHFKRFEGLQVKITRHIEFAMHLDMAAFMVRNAARVV